MNYRKLYDIICDIGRTNRNLEYSEKHHIIPKSMNGTDDEINITRLTAREHYLAHWLLYKMHPTVWKISNAFFLMSIENNRNNRRITSTQYERAKIAMSSNCSKRMKDIGNPMHKQAAKDKISESMSGDNNPMRRFPEKNHVLNGGSTPSMNGAKWWNNGTKSKYFGPDDIIPVGWLAGMATYKDRGKWITDEIRNRKLKSDQEVPEGFRFGKVRIK